MNQFKKLLAVTVALTTAVSPAASFAATDKPASSSSFTDIDTASPWARDLIAEVKKLGLMSGDMKGTFRPKDTVTRQEVAAILVNLLHLQTPDVARSSFSDVSSANWGMKQIEAVAQAGLMAGYKGTFRPNDPITREEMAAILVHAAKGSADGKGDSLKLADRDDVSPWAKGYVQAAMEIGLMSGDGSHFYPQKSAQRQEVAAMLLNFMKVTQGVGQGDAARVSAALTAVNQADEGSMQSALENHAADLTIDLSASGSYGQLPNDEKQIVALDVYANRPEGGFQTANDVKTLFDRAVTTRTVIRQSLADVNHAASVDDILAQNRKFLTDVIAALEEAEKIPDFTVESGSKISDTLTQYRALVADYDGLTDQQKRLVSSAIQGQSFASYPALIQAFSAAVKQAALLIAINEAPEFNTMKSLLEKNAQDLGIDVSAGSDYMKLLGDTAGHPPNYDNQLNVAKDVLDNKPAGGYTNVNDVKTVFNQSVNVRTLFLQELNRVQTATSAGDLSDASYITDVITALEDAMATPNLKMLSGTKIDDLLLRMKKDMIAYNALSQEAQAAVNQAIAGHAYGTYNELLAAFEQAIETNTHA
ncbi:hypothetical protein DNHGIG_11850 [Collibacillus ludicampi]|uniref:SLH domain-containing protein n=1 Tax=Collibacillus ludicampi TaxID=2771369 RepID=A0AAV4LCW4_9BACL|nr:S-layer homology domain-containing protein [Collibacillus ludicampi]GIM45636.1 hypothetical protein DNHGIG_11850 [Collibacillus ludicampi]